jgi:serine/threonine-protein kinase
MPAPPGALEPGVVVDGRYVLGHAIGQGGAATVFHAEDPELGRDVAIKFLIGAGHVADPARFHEEAQILAGLQHPHIVTMYGFGVHGAHPYLVLELMDGGTLSARAFAGALPPEQALEVSRAVASALAAAHEHGVLHRDVKPGNVLLTARGIPKLADFGLAKSSTSQVRTATGMIMGTPEFMAPEVFTGAAPGPAADVYAWGCLAYYCVNRRPLAEGDVRAVARAHTTGAYTPGVETGQLADAIRAALDVDPRARPSAGEVVEILDGRRRVSTKPLPAVTAARVPPRHRAPPSARSRQGMVVAVTFALLGGAGGVLWWAAPDGASLPAIPEEVVRFPEALVADWRARGVEVQAPQRIAAIHQRVMVDPEGATYLVEMSRFRLGVGDRVHAAALEAVVEELPMRDEMRRARDELLGVAKDPRYPFLRRAELAHALRPFAYLDEYFEAFGLPAPYGVRAIRQAVHPWEFVPGERPRPPHDQLAVVDPREPLGPGRHLLHQWSETRDQDLPWLVAQGGEPHAQELQWILVAKLATGNKWNRDDHQFLRGRFTLGPEPGNRFPEVEVSLEVGNLHPPQVLEVELNEHVVQVMREAEGLPTSSWRRRDLARHRLVLTFPGELLREGPNAVRVAVRPLPGLLRYQGMEGDRIWIDLPEPPSEQGKG